jgi:hypothetical protein
MAVGEMFAPVKTTGVPHASAEATDVATTVRRTSAVPHASADGIADGATF